DTVSVIDTSNNTVIDTDTNQDGFQEIQVGDMPYSGIAVSPNGKFVYVGNFGDDTVSIIGF
ncbi:MAG: YncE family protein, partial [Desulfobacterales bacterium]